MFIDRELQFGDKQAVNATGYSTDTVTVPTGLNTGIDMYLQVVARSESGTNPTLHVELEGSSDNVTFTKGVGVTKPAGKKIFCISLENVPLRQYLRLRYVLGGSSPAYNLTAMLVAGQTMDATDGILPNSVRIS